MPNAGKADLKVRSVVRFGIGLPLIAAVLFLPAGSLRFWNGWAFLILVFGGSVAIFLYLYRCDRPLLERRLKSKEQLDDQKFFRKLSLPLWMCGLLLAGFDYRFGWSRTFVASVPVWLSVLSQVCLCCALFLLFQVLKVNSFASSIIEVDSEQRVISTGPYGIVRHPMYSAILVLVFCTPLALGSYVALPVFLPLILLVIIRLVNEEKVLRQELPGYSEYCRRIRFRLVPLVF